MKKVFFGLILISLFILSSCGGKKIIYVQDMNTDTDYPVKNVPVLRVQKGDRLSISVESRMPELVAQFNTGTGATVNTDGSITTTTTNQSSGNVGYLVDQYGNINFPILGVLSVSGLTLEEVRQLIYTRLVSDKLVVEPLVKVDLINFKVVVTGMVGSQQVIEVTDGKLTLIDALTRSGGLTNNSLPDKIFVIREENGVRKKIVTDIRSKDVFDSPAYYLQQNDIVFVEPRSKQGTLNEERNIRFFTTFIGTLAVLISVINLTK